MKSENHLMNAMGCCLLAILSSDAVLNKIDRELALECIKRWEDMKEES